MVESHSRIASTNVRPKQCVLLVCEARLNDEKLSKVQLFVRQSEASYSTATIHIVLGPAKDLGKPQMVQPASANCQRRAPQAPRLLTGGISRCGSGGYWRLFGYSPDFGGSLAREWPPSASSFAWVYWGCSLYSGLLARVIPLVKLFLLWMLRCNWPARLNPP
jgi:hypothetical protein